MPRFFISAAQKLPASDTMPLGGFTVTGSDAHHIAFSLRMRRGDIITVCDMQRIEYRCEIRNFVKTDSQKGEVQVLCAVLESHASDTEPSYHAVLYQALPKAGKLDIIIQKAVETGVSEIVPFLSERCIARPDSESAQKKLARWQKIASEAAMQCGRACVPTVRPVVSFDEAVSGAAACELGFLCYEGEGTVPLARMLNGVPTPKTVGFLIGAEGGFGYSEVEAAKAAGLLTAGLGKRILRCETASGFVLSCLTYRFDLM